MGRKSNIEVKRNLEALKNFRNNATIHDENGLRFTTYCKVHCSFDGQSIDEDAEVKVERYSEDGRIKLHGRNISESINETFSPKLHTYEWVDDKLIITGGDKKKTFKVVIGEYAANSLMIRD